MKKAVKSTLIWGTTALVAGGIAVAIAIPVINAKNKNTNTSPITADPNNVTDMTTPVGDNLPSLGQVQEAADNTGIKDTSLLTKLQYQLSFKLYNDEQIGSVSLQKLYFQWDLYGFNKKLKNLIKNDLKFDESPEVAAAADVTAVKALVAGDDDLAAGKLAVKSLVVDDAAAAAITLADGSKPYTTKALYDAAVDAAVTYDAVKKVAVDAGFTSYTTPASALKKADGTFAGYISKAAWDSAVSNASSLSELKSLVASIPSLTAPTWSAGTKDKALSYTPKGETQAKEFDTITAVELNESKELFDALVAKAQAIITAKLNVTPAPSAEEKAYLNGYQSTLDNIKRDWNNKTKLIENVEKELKTKDGIDYGSSTLSTDYPKLLLPLKNIRDKQLKIFNDTKTSFMASYSDKASGNAEWQKTLSSKYGGATTDAGAVDYLTNQQIAASAWNKYKYAVNKDFTFEMFKTNIFKDILGEATPDATSGIYDPSTAKVVFRKVTDKNDYKEDDKVYFFGTSSKIIADINISGEKTASDAVFAKQANIMKVQNAILGFKQGADKDAAWTVTKEQLTKLFTALTVKAGPTTAADQWEHIFVGDTTDDGKELTKLMIATSSDTTDATQWKSGDLGWQTQLSGLAGYYEGFSLGIASALDDMAATHQFGGAVKGPDVLKNLMAKMKTQLTAYATFKKWTLPAITATSTPAEVTTYNKSVAALLSAITEGEIAEYFGRPIADYFKALQVDAQGHIAASGTALNGLPATIRLDDGSALGAGVGVFMVVSDQAQGGIHIIKVSTGNAAVTSMIDEFQKDADSDKQDGTKITTEWGKFTTDAYSQIAQFADILKIDTTTYTGTDAELTAIQTELQQIQDELRGQYNDNKFSILSTLGYKIGTNPDKEYIDEAHAWKALSKDLAEYIVSQRRSEGLSKVQSGYRADLFTWLQTKIDKGLWTEGGADHKADFTITPDEIYDTLLVAEGIK